MSSDNIVQLIAGSALGLGGLGYGLYNIIDTQKKLTKANNSMLNLNGRMRNLGMSATDPELGKLLKQEIGTDVPVAVVTDKNKINELGIGDNAFYVTPSGAESYAEELGIQGDVANKGAVIVSGKFGSLPILAHELGHAKDYEEGRLSNPWVNTLLQLGGAGLGLAAVYGVPEIVGSYTGNSDPLTPAISGIGSGLAIFALTSYLVNQRELGDERRASEKAKQALTRVAEKLGKHKELKNTDKMLDTALSTYEAQAKYEQRALLARALGYGGLLTAATAMLNK